MFILLFQSGIFQSVGKQTTYRGIRNYRPPHRFYPPPWHLATSPSDALLQFCLDNNLSDILINRNEHGSYKVTGTGTHAPAPPPVTIRTSSTRKYLCPCCGNSVRATKSVNIGCLDCQAPMILAG